MTRALAIGACAIGVVQCLTAAMAGVSDFSMFLATARALVDGSPPYEIHNTPAGPWRNLLPPHAHVLFLPLLWFPDEAATAIWKMVDLSLLFGVLWFTVRRLGLSAERVLWTVAVVTNAAPTLVEAYAGQVTGPLLAGLAIALCQAQARRWTSAGIVWGVLCSVKPFLGLLALWFLRRGRPSAIPAGMLAAGLAWAFGMWAFGTRATQEWLNALGGVAWEGSPYNASITGLVSRTCGGEGCEPLRWLLIVGVLVVLAATVFWTWSLQDEELVVLLVLAALLVSPLGWLYSIWLAIPSLVAIAGRSRKVPVAALGLLIHPNLLALGYGSNALAPWLGSTYSIVLLVMWLELIWYVSRSRASANEALPGKTA